jgi:hypothetical protein
MTNTAAGSSGRRPAAADKKRDGYAFGFAGLAASLIVALVVALLFVFLSLGSLGGAAGGEYAGLAVLFVGVLIFLGALVGFGVLLLIFFLATGRKQAIVVAVVQIVLSGVLLAIFLGYIAS